MPNTLKYSIEFVLLFLRSILYVLLKIATEVRVLSQEAILPSLIQLSQLSKSQVLIQEKHLQSVHCFNDFKVFKFFDLYDSISFKFVSLAEDFLKKPLDSTSFSAAISISKYSRISSLFLKKNLLFN